MTVEIILNIAFLIGALGITITEVILIIQVIKLRQVLQKVNSNIDNTQEMINTKLRGLIDLFVKAQMMKFDSFKGGELKVKTENYEADISLKKGGEKDE